MKQGDTAVYTGCIASLTGKTGTIEKLGAWYAIVKFKGFRNRWKLGLENLKPAPSRFKLLVSRFRSWATLHAEDLTGVAIALIIMLIWAAVLFVMYGGKL